jgi:hypothetical protein
MHNFSLSGEVFLYFILRVEVVEIQISLQIINSFGKRKGVFNSILAVGRNPAGNRARPNSHPFSPHAGAAQRGPAEAACPQPRRAARPEHPLSTCEAATTQARPSVRRRSFPHAER